MEREQLIEKIKNLGMNPDNLTSENINKLIEMQIKGEFGKDVLKEFIKENNTTYKTFVDGIVNLTKIHESASDTYSQTLKWLVEDLRKESEKAITSEEKDRVDKRIDEILNRLQKESADNKEHGLKFGKIVAGVAVVGLGTGIFVFTKNPELLKKGTQLIAQEAVKQVLK
ncbi:hypothetical protein AB685_00355 [Bacillus sp. LL01]|uniref:hypothetical protein n=1 Tax=Bacillus sp. LL01 TaxID=1665556 RepID=UPI00064D6DF1|nr:hypothetical protein [Bacillus sp. LL01]KMJ59379.1 hypothetical protein AB685_00355 [Bacillus sp. LL01]